MFKSESGGLFNMNCNMDENRVSQQGQTTSENNNGREGRIVCKYYVNNEER